MEKIFDIIILIGILYVLYLCIQTYKPTCDSNIEPNIDSNIEPNIEPNIEQKLFEQSPKKVKFNYEQNIPNEQAFNVQLSTWYPNTWIERIDENGEPVYNSRENVTKVKEEFIESKARFTYEFNSPRSVQMNGISDPTNFKDHQGKTIKEIYDNSVVDYKKIVPKKTMIQTDTTHLNTQSAGSNLSSIIPDNWVYDEEKPENGGQFENGLMGYDPFASSSISNSLSVIDY
jgi:hypothetical protein